jgi:hypothetical protein
MQLLWQLTNNANMYVQLAKGAGNGAELGCSKNKLLEKSILRK